MIWLVLLVLLVAALAPLAISVRRDAAGRGRREAALALHRAQLADLDRDLAEGRIAASEHVTAVLEVQRRLLAAGREQEAIAASGSRAPLWLALVIVPAIAIALYRIGGSPGLPDAPYAARQVERQDEDALMQTLQQRLVAMDQKSEETREGFMLLGSAEESRGRWRQAAAAFQSALAARFEPTLAARTAEAISRSQGHVTADAAALFRRALADAPPDAPWRGLAEQRIREAGS